MLSHGGDLGNTMIKNQEVHEATFVFAKIVGDDVVVNEKGIKYYKLIREINGERKAMYFVSKINGDIMPADNFTVASKHIVGNVLKVKKVAEL